MIDLLDERVASRGVSGRFATSPTGGELWRLLAASLDAAFSGSVSGYRTTELTSGNVLFVYTESLFALDPDTLPALTRTKISYRVNASGAPGRVTLPPQPQREPVAAAVTAVELIDRIQDALSLSVTQIAELVGVTRATVYNWIRDRAPVPKSEVAAERLRHLAKAAHEWQELSSRDPRRYLNMPVGETQTSLLARFREDPWNEARIKRGLEAVAAKAESEARQALTSTSGESARPADLLEERESLRSLNRRMRRGR
jgi:transcriptional regulator with XRE-family HTH domain